MNLSRWSARPAVIVITSCPPHPQAHSHLRAVALMDSLRAAPSQVMLVRTIRISAQVTSPWRGLFRSHLPLFAVSLQGRLRDWTCLPKTDALHNLHVENVWSTKFT